MDPLRSAEAMPLVRDCSQSPEIRHISTAKGRLKAQSPNIDLSSEGFSDADLERTRLIIRDLLRRGMIEELHNEGELDPYGHNKELKATVGIELEVAALDAKTGAPTRSGPKIIEHLRQKRREERRVHGVWTEELGASFAERVFEERPIGDRLAEKIQTDINGAYQEFRQAQAEMGLVEEVAGVALPPNLTAEQMGEDWLTPADRFDRLTEYALKVRQGSISVSLRTRDTNEEVKVDYPGIAPWFASLQINVQPENREMLLKLANLASAFSGLLLAGTVSSPFFAGETCSKESRLEVFSQAWDMGRFGDNRVLDSIQDYFAQTLDHAPILFEDDFVRSPEIEHDKDGDPDTRMQRYIAAIRKDILDDEKRGDYQTSYGTPYLTFHA